MKLITPVPLTTSSHPIDYASRVLMLGSCFAENMGSKLSYYGFRSSVNPLGIVFNPYSLNNQLQRCFRTEPFTEKDIVEGRFCYATHSSLYTNESASTLAALNEAAQQQKHQIEKASHIMVTLGTAWVYRLNETGTIVANCHKQPQRLFTKELLSIKAIVEALTSFVHTVKSVNVSARLTFTLSPVRHLKDGFIENQRSKGRLHDAIHTVCETKEVDYFPSYEIVMDEMRDYRFYKNDFIHLNPLGIDYVWERFSEKNISPAVQAIMSAVEKYRRLSLHKPSNTTLHKEKVSALRSSLLARYPIVVL